MTVKHAVVALVGRPNVGKSALFNRLTGKTKAIVHDQAGLTRDRHYDHADWLGREFVLIDTGGFDDRARDSISAQIRRQMELALDEADVVIMVADGRTPLDRLDRELAARLRRAGKPTVLAVNKIDNDVLETETQAFWALGLGEPHPVSALHSRRIDDLLDALLPLLPEAEGPSEDDTVIKLAVVGRPNVGKSSLVNRILGENRSLVSDLPGTTRDSVSSRFTRGERTYEIVDTAGLRARRKVTAGVEAYAVVRALRSIEEAHVVIMLLDASRPLTEQDEHIAGYIHEAGRACILAVNKWDLLDKDTHTTDGSVQVLRRRLAFLDYAPIITLSAKTGQRVDRLLDLAAFVDEQHVMRIKTSLLNQALQDMLRKHSPPTRRGRPLKVKYISQTGVRPPAFALFVNDPQRMHFAYLRHLKNGLRERFGLEGTPIIFMLRGEKEARRA